MRLTASTTRWSLAALVLAGAGLAASYTRVAAENGRERGLEEGELLPTGARITPTAADGASFQALNPDLAGRPDFVVGQAVTTALGPDGATLLVLTSGYNRNSGPDGRRVAADSREYIFVYDVTTRPPVKRQVLTVANTFSGLAWNPSGNEFYASGAPRPLGADGNGYTVRASLGYSF
jgi:hypothetical protein